MAMHVISVLGFTLAPDKTPPPSPSQDILGVTIILEVLDDSLYFRATVEPRKLMVWHQQVEEAISTGRLSHIDGEKLVGRLGFAAWAVWGPIAWTHLRRLQLHVLQGLDKVPEGLKRS